MALSDYKFCSENALVQAVKSGESYVCVIDGQIACAMSSGGAHRFHTKQEAITFGGWLKRGYNSGTFLSEDVSDHI